jgi:hypothetical protein
MTDMTDYGYDGDDFKYFKQTKIIPMYNNSNNKNNGPSKLDRALNYAAKKLSSNKSIATAAIGSMLVSGFLLGKCYEEKNGFDVDVKGAPDNMQLIDYAFTQDQPTKKVVSITLLPNVKYDTLLNNNGRIVVKGKVNYDIDCSGIDNKTLCNDTRECQLTFKTIDDKLKN